MHAVYLIAVILLVSVLDIVALVQIWRDPARSLFARVAWTVVIAILPLVGGVGWFINWAIGRAANRLNGESVS